jgi:NADPH:quinone reductase
MIARRLAAMLVIDPYRRWLPRKRYRANAGKLCLHYGDTSVMMKAVAYRIPMPIEDEASLVDVELPKPAPTGRDILVRVRAVSVNPVDVKLRANSAPSGSAGRVLGFDAAGTVTAVGPDVELFKLGDDVFYAGALDRAGSNAEYQLVDERIVGPKPTNLDFAEAAALPLTAITAWEGLFDRLDVRRKVPGATHAILVIGGAGGVGSIVIQLARALTDMTVIASASRAETQQWCRELGAHHVVDHSRPLADEIEKLGIGLPAFVFMTTQTDQHVGEVAKLIAPQGRILMIDDPRHFDVAAFKRKSVSIGWEFMFTRSIFQTSDMSEQSEILREIARLVEAGKIRSTLSKMLGPVNATNMRRAHSLVESGRTCGKLVLAEFAT